MTTLPCFRIWVLLGILLQIFCGNAPSKAYAWGDLTLDDAVEELSSTLADQGKLRGALVLISPHDLYDAKTGLSLPFSNQLRSRLITEMRRQGVRVLLPGADDENFMVLQGTWTKQGNDLEIDLKVMHLSDIGPEAVAAASAKVPLKEIDQEALIPDRHSWARYLVRNLEKNTALPASRTVHLGRIKVNENSISDTLPSYLAGWLRPALAQSAQFHPLDREMDLVKLPTETLRSRGINKVHRQNSGGASSLTADIQGAQCELTGETWEHELKTGR